MAKARNPIFFGFSGSREPSGTALAAGYSSGTTTRSPPPNGPHLPACSRASRRFSWATARSGVPHSASTRRSCPESRAVRWITWNAARAGDEKTINFLGNRIAAAQVPPGRPPK